MFYEQEVNPFSSAQVSFRECVMRLTKWVCHSLVGGSNISGILNLGIAYVISFCGPCFIFQWDKKEIF